MKTKAQYIISALVAVAVLICLCASDVFAITREEVIQNAERYAEYEWTVQKGNSNSRWNKWREGKRIKGIPYNWCGFDSIEKFKKKIERGEIAGNTKRCYRNDKTTWRGDFAGVDCSGFVSRTWETSSKYGTGSLNGISEKIPWSNLKPGDILNRSGNHVRLFHHFTNDNRTMIYEATTTKGYNRVVHRVISRDNKYVLRKYKKIEDSSASPLIPTSTSAPTGPKPSVTEVRPNPLPPSPVGQKQWITIYGKNFTRNSKIELEIIGEKKFGKRPKRRLAYESGTELRYHINVGPKENEWSVRVNNDGQVSNACSFKVAYAPAILESHEEVREAPSLEPHLSKPEAPEIPAEEPEHPESPEEPVKKEVKEDFALELYLSKPEPPESPEKPVQVEESLKKTKDIISQSVYHLIQSASEKALLLRRDILEIPHLEKRHNIAIQLENTRLTEGYEKQLKEKKENIRLGLSDYESIIKSLADADPKTVSEEFDDYANKMTEAGRFDKIKIIKVINRHHQDYLKHNTLNMAAIQEDLKKL